MEYVYVRLADASGSFTDLEQSVSLGGIENLPVRVKKTPKIQQAILYRAIVLVDSKEAENLLRSKGKLTPVTDVTVTLAKEPIVVEPVKGTIPSKPKHRRGNS